MDINQRAILTVLVLIIIKVGFLYSLVQGLNSLGLADVSNDPEALRFQYQPLEETRLHHNSAPAKKKSKAVYKEQVS